MKYLKWAAAGAVVAALGVLIWFLIQQKSAAGERLALAEEELQYLRDQMKLLTSSRAVEEAERELKKLEERILETQKRLADLDKKNEEAVAKITKAKKWAELY
jgi:peptidoglycan hydrolase CwlO-like protein